MQGVRSVRLAFSIIQFLNIFLLPISPRTSRRLRDLPA
nr:MAG TPA: hypothetical protein [Caudoviricetes sp.]